MFLNDIFEKEEEEEEKQVYFETVGLLKTVVGVWVASLL